MNQRITTPSDRSIQRAASLLRAQGYTVLPPASPRKSATLDQCEYPDRLGEPGDCCTNFARRKRHTRYGWLWLCANHIAAPEAELFDDRLACHAD